MISLSALLEFLPQNPIFIVGFPRSGTTLLQSMLATQNNLYSFPETHYFCSILPHIITDENGFLERRSLENVIENIRNEPYLEFPNGIEAEIQKLPRNSFLSGKMLFEWFVLYYLLQQIAPDKLSTIRWIEKTPAHVFWLDKIHEFYPNAKFIEIIRNPLNAIYSCKNKLPDGDGFSSVSLAVRWMESNDAFERFRIKYPKQALSIQYENLIKNQEIEFGKLCMFLEIEPNFEQLKHTSQAARNLTLKWEDWKKDNINKGIDKYIQGYKWPLRERLKITYILKEKIIQYGYSTEQSKLQIPYDRFFDFVSTNALNNHLNPVKPFVRYLLKKVNLLPYSHLQRRHS